MTKKTLLRKINLSQKDLDEIKEAVANQEKNTNGEIALALTAESNDYSFWELLTSVYIAAFIFVILLPFSSKIDSFYKLYFWHDSSWILPAFYGIATLVSIFVSFALLNIPCIDRKIIPTQVKNKNVTNRAFRHFAESGVYDTENHSGILIFVSYLEKQVRIIADSGINAKISQDLWNIIADELTENLKKGKTKEGFLGAVEKCGSLLQENFPAKKENPNELSDGLVILED